MPLLSPCALTKEHISFEITILKYRAGKVLHSVACLSPLHLRQSDSWPSNRHPQRPAASDYFILSFVALRVQHGLCSKFLLWILGLKLMGLERYQVILDPLNARALARFRTLFYNFLPSCSHWPWVCCFLAVLQLWNRVNKPLTPPSRTDRRNGCIKLVLPKPANASA